MKRIYSLDILKFVFSILILYLHYLQLTGLGTYSIAFLGGNILLGHLVEMFFIISGFLIAGSLGKISQLKFKDYIIRKIIRIYPMAAMSVLVSALVGFVYYKLYGEFFFNVAITPWQLLSSMLLINSGGMLKSGLGINNPLWYLNVLMYCYIITYFIVWISNRRRIKSIYFFIGMMCLGLSVLQYEIDMPFMNQSSGRGYSSFFFGIILYFIWQSVSHNKLVLYSLISSLLCVCTYVFEYELYAANQREVSTYLLFPAILFLALRLDECLNLSFIKPLKLGDLSYEIYVWHYCVISVIMLVDRRYEFVFSHIHKTFIFCVMTVILLSFILNHSLEKRITGYLMHKYT